MKPSEFITAARRELTWPAHNIIAHRCPRSPGGSASRGTAEMTGPAVADFARQFAGVPYPWPAPDGDDSDCADFVTFILADAPERRLA